MLMPRRWSGCSTCWRGDDPGSERGAGVAGRWTDRHAQRHERAGAAGPAGAGARDPHAGDLYVFRGIRGDLIKIVWHDGIGMSLYAKRLERGRFIWPPTADGIVAISAVQLAYMLDGIDWRHPVRTRRPEVAG
jgi:transposase